jgi:isochorismate synthase
MTVSVEGTALPFASADGRGQAPAVERATVARALAPRTSTVSTVSTTAPQLRLVAWPAPVAPAETLLAMPGPAYVWGDVECGLGTAAVVAASGTTRFADVRTQADALFARIVREPHVAPPRLVGGAAFTAGGCAGAECWRELDDARFMLPRWRYCRGSRGAMLTLALADGESERDLRGERDCLLALLAEPPPLANAPAIATCEQLPLATWRRAIAEVMAVIAGGECAKVVIARAARLVAKAPIDPRTVLARLLTPATTRFAVRVGQTCFLGASPERLVVRRGAAVHADALAGSGTSATALLASSKDRREHAFVVTAIAESLAPWCTRLDVPATPTTRALRDLVHLHTPIAGVVHPGAHVLDLVAALHPTPAVAGVPTRDALAWIARVEPAARGWYAGPFGWFDASGDGSFVVALRSGVLDGASATIFAGAGIVEGSDPDAEYHETALKQRALAVALGALT